jgi:hypothetical protein
MIDRARLMPLAALLAALAACSGSTAATPAAAARSPLVTVPPDASFVPYTCSGSPASGDAAGDPTGDPATGGAQRDIVGDVTYPAFYRAADAENVFFRMRVSGDPRKPGGTELQPSSWDVLVDTDGDPSAYEYMLTADGNIAGGTHVQWVQNTTKEPNNPQDPAELLVADLTPATDYWSVKTTGDGSAFGGDPDYFITLAVPRTLLTAAGVDLGRPFTVWAGTNAQTYSLNSDFACWAGIPPTLADAGSDPGPLDPVGHPDAVPDSATIPAGTPVTTTVLANDTGLEDGPIAVTIDAPPANGTAQVNGDGTITYTPAPGFVGTDTYVYRVTDTQGETDAAPVTVTVTAGPIDSDGDGLPDDVEDPNHNGTVDPGETDPHNPDTNGDGILDGVGVRGGGCASGAGGAASLLLAGLALSLRRRRPT